MKNKKNKKIFLLAIFVGVFFMNYNFSLAAGTGCCVTDLTVNTKSNCQGNVDEISCIAKVDINGFSTDVYKIKTFIAGDPNCAGVQSMKYCGTNGANALNASGASGSQIQNNSVPGASVDAKSGIVQCGRPGGQMCTLCDLIKGINKIIHYIMDIAIFVALLAMAIGGVLYVVSAGESAAMEMAKSTIMNAAIGFVIVFAAWLIVNTTITFLGVNETLGMKTATTWGDFNCSALLVVSPENAGTSTVAGADNALATAIANDMVKICGGGNLGTCQKTSAYICPSGWEDASGGTNCASGYKCCIKTSDVYVNGTNVRKCGINLSGTCQIRTLLLNCPNDNETPLTGGLPCSGIYTCCGSATPTNGGASGSF